MLSVARPTKLKCTEIFGVSIGHMIHSSFLSAEFRNATTLLEQIDFVKNYVKSATVSQICSLFNISTRRYYKAINNNEKPTVQLLSMPPSQQLLLADEESHILSQVFEHQVNNDCLTSRDIRDMASDIYKIRTGDERSFSRDWARNFLRRHSDELDKIKTCSVDDDRANIDLEEVKRYISQVERILSNNPNPLLVLNMDETGFGRRPEKGKRKNVIISKRCTVQPFWRENTDSHHISLIMCISAACDYLRPMLISTRARFDPDIANTFFHRWSEYTKTLKGYQTSNSMVYWIKNVLAPYVSLIRSVSSGNKTCFLIIDGCTAHFNDEVNSEIEKIGDVIIVPIPPHSSHISQMLDATIFGSLKRRYGSTPSNSLIESKFTRKLIRIKQAFQTCITEELIRSGWEATGFNLEVTDGIVTKITFDENFKKLLLAEAGDIQDESMNE